MNFFKKIGIFILFIYLIICFFPKKNLYFYAEEVLNRYKVVLYDEKTTDYGLVFDIQKANIAYEDVKIGDVKDINFFFGLFYNTALINNAVFSENIKSFLPNKIEKLKIIYTPLYPIKSWIKASGDFGELQGEINIYTKKGKLILKPSNLMQKQYQALMYKFKNIEGNLIYEFSF